MDATSKVHTTRRLLVAVIVVGAVMGVVGAVIGMGIPGLSLSVVGWGAVIAAVCWLITSHNQRSAADSRAGSWRPGDADTTR